MIDNYLYFLRKSFQDANIHYDQSHHERDYFLISHFLQFFGFELPNSKFQEQSSNIQPKSDENEEQTFFEPDDSFYKNSNSSSMKTDFNPEQLDQTLIMPNSANQQITPSEQQSINHQQQYEILQIRSQSDDLQEKSEKSSDEDNELSNAEDENDGLSFNYELTYEDTDKEQINENWSQLNVKNFIKKKFNQIQNIQIFEEGESGKVLQNQRAGPKKMSIQDQRNHLIQLNKQNYRKKIKYSNLKDKIFDYQGINLRHDKSINGICQKISQEIAKQNRVITNRNHRLKIALTLYKLKNIILKKYPSIIQKSLNKQMHKRLKKKILSQFKQTNLKYDNLFKEQLNNDLQIQN